LKFQQILGLFSADCGDDDDDLLSPSHKLILTVTYLGKRVYADTPGVDSNVSGWSRPSVVAVHTGVWRFQDRPSQGGSVVSRWVHWTFRPHAPYHTGPGLGSSENSRDCPFFLLPLLSVCLLLQDLLQSCAHGGT